MYTQIESFIQIDTHIEYERKDVKCMYMNIEAKRARNNLSQDELSKKLGITRKTYYEKQLKEDFSAEMLIKMSKLFNCSIDYLLGLTRNPKIQK